MSRVRRHVWVLCSLVLAGLAIFTVSAVSTPESQAWWFEDGPGSGQRPPAFSAKDLTGTEQTLAKYAGNVVVLHFWATWCGYCRAEIPKLKEVHQRWSSRGVTILAVSIDEDPARLRSFIKQALLPYEVIPDGENDFAISLEYGLVGVPLTYIIAPDGRVALRFAGPADLTGAVERMLQDRARNPRVQPSIQKDNPTE